MVAVTSTAYSTNSYYRAAATAQAAGVASGGGTASTATSQQAATSVTLSDEAMAALAERDFATVLADAQSKLATLLTEAERTSPLEGGKLALDLSSLDPRELYAPRGFFLRFHRFWPSLLHSRDAEGPRFTAQACPGTSNRTPRCRSPMRISARRSKHDLSSPARFKSLSSRSVRSVRKSSARC